MRLADDGGFHERFFDYGSFRRKTTGWNHEGGGAVDKLFLSVMFDAVRHRWRSGDNFRAELLLKTLMERLSQLLE